MRVLREGSFQVSKDYVRFLKSTDTGDTKVRERSVALMADNFSPTKKNIRERYIRLSKSITKLPPIDHAVKVKNGLTESLFSRSLAILRIQDVHRRRRLIPSAVSTLVEGRSQPSTIQLMQMHFKSVWRRTKNRSCDGGMTKLTKRTGTSLTLRSDLSKRRKMKESLS